MAAPDLVASGLTDNDELVAQLARAVSGGDHSLSTVPGVLKRVLRQEAWRDRVIRGTGRRVQHRAFIEFVTARPQAGLGADLALLQRLCADDLEALDLLDQVTIGEHGGDRKSVKIKSYNITLDRAKRGTLRQYALRKLRKDRPDLHARVLAGELTPHAATVEAGFRQRTITVPLTADGFARAARKHLDVAQRAALITALQEETP